MSAPAAVAPYDLWSKLPGDLLGVVYGKIGSPLDRVRFAAVCRSWRTTTSWHPPAPTTLPWLILSRCEDGTAERVYCPVDGALLRVPLPPEAAGKQLVGFHDGGWIAATAAVADGASLVIVNMFSGVEVPLSAKQRDTPTIWKLVFSEAPTSKRCILAATILNGLALCRIGCRQRDWWPWEEYGDKFRDIAFSHGGTKLYGLYNELLTIFDVRMTKKGCSPMITTAYQLSATRVLNTTAWQSHRFGYIVNHGDRLLMALMSQWSLEHGYIFKVFEVVDTNDDSMPDKYTWEEVTTLDDHALLLGATCSKVVHVPPGRQSGIEGNHIYYNYTPLTIESDSICDDPLLEICGNGERLYRREDQASKYCTNGIASVGYWVNGSGDCLTWLLPPDF